VRQLHSFCQRFREEALPCCSPSLATRRSRLTCPPPAQTKTGIPRKAEPGWRPSTGCRRMRHREGKNTPTSASLAPVNHLRTLRRLAADASLDELARSTPATIYSFCFLIKEEMHPGVIEHSQRSLGGTNTQRLDHKVFPARHWSSPCSIFSWQAIQCFAHGTASSRFCCSSSWQFAHTPYSSL
jgi:hypothetical protein